MVFINGYATPMNQPENLVEIPDFKKAIADFDNHRVTIFNEVPNKNGAEADVVLGQPNFISSTSFFDATHPGDPTEYNMEFPYSINFDLNGRLLVKYFTFTANKLKTLHLPINHVQGAGATEISSSLPFWV